MKPFLSSLLVCGLCGTSARADLMKYVAKPDPTFEWSALGTERAGNGVEYAEIHMVSQTWRGIAWKHRLVIMLPPEPVTTTHALLIVAGGSWRDGMERERLESDSRELRMGVAIAAAARMPVAFLRHVPFQPMFNGLKEDEIISLTFDEYLKGGDDDWPLLLPMTKSAVRAMDVIQAFAAQKWKLKPEKFVVTGASKRGWTTWLTAVADSRVAGIAPMVIDVLNMSEQMKRQKEIYGGYSEEVGDYTRLKIQDRMDTDAGRKLLSIVDPYAYRERLTLPKMILLGTNDPYWTLEALNLYYDGLEGEKHILYVPNVGHDLRDFNRVVNDVSSFALKVAGKLEFPKLSWSIEEAGSSLVLEVRSDRQPSQVDAWVAESATRDFRRAAWRSKSMESTDGTYRFELPRPKEGFAAAFGEAVYQVDGRPLFLSTNVRMIGSREASPSPKPSSTDADRGNNADAFFEAELIFPPREDHNHAPGIVECPNGDLLVSWYRGSGERSADDVAVYGSRRRKGTTQWSEPFLMADTPGFPDCNTAMHVDAGGRLWLFWPVIVANSWESCITHYRISSDYEGDGPPKWSWQGVIYLKPDDFERAMLEGLDERLKMTAGTLPGDLRVQAKVDQMRKLIPDKLASRLGWQPRCKPTVLPSGRILLPLYSDTYSVGIMAISDDEGQTWYASKPLAGFGSIQPTVLRRNDGVLVAYMRENGPLERIRVSESADDGITWGPVGVTDLPNPGAGIDGLRLADGRWLLVYNDTTDGRSSLAVSLSDDEGRTWRWTRHLERQAKGAYHYPVIIQARDGTIHVVYSYFLDPGGKSMKHAQFTQEWIRRGDPATRQ